MSRPGASPWPLVGLLYLTGLLAAAQLGKLSALAPLVAAALGLGLPLVALAISLIELGGATLGMVAGLLAQRLGLARCLRWGVGALALAGLGGALAQGAAGLIGWRLLEAVGYLGVIVSAPVLIARHAARAAGDAGARTQGLALTLWSTFVPVGMALGAWGSAGAAAWLGWRGAVALGGGVALLLWAVLWRARLPADGGTAAADPPPASAAAGASALTPTTVPALTPELTPAPTSAPTSALTPALTPGPTPAPASAPASASTPPLTPALTPALWCLALAFGAFALFEVGMLGLLPTLLVQQAGLGAAAAGQWTGLAALAAVGGSAAAALLLRHGMGLRGPVLLSLGLPPLLLFGVFSNTPQPALAVGLAVLLNMLGGVFASLTFALLPRLAAGPGQLVRANGLLAQCGASGSLLGPPAMAACVALGGWPAAAGLGLLVSLAALPLAWRALRSA